MVSYTMTQNMENKNNQMNMETIGLKTENEKLRKDLMIVET